jgi:Spy/CpxP family protein refolding chaperone
MKRFGWLILLVSLGLNLGLSYRLLNRPDPSAEPGFGPGPEEEFLRDGQHRRGGFDEGPGRDWRESRRDSNQWRQIMEGRLDRVARRLELTPQQVEVFRTAHRSNQPRILAQRGQVDAARDHLQVVIAGEGTDPESVRQAISDLGHRQAVLDSLITETLLQEMEILSPEQRARYLQILPVLKGSVSGRGPGRGGHHRTR